MTFTEFCLSVLLLCRLHGASVTSWIRSAKHNAAVGGVKTSKHLSGLGLDVVLDDKKTKPAFLITAGLLGLAVIDEGDHLHVQVPK